MNPDPLYLTPEEIRLDRKYNQSDRMTLAEKAAAEEAEDAAEWAALGETDLIDQSELADICRACGFEIDDSAFCPNPECLN